MGCKTFVCCGLQSKGGGFLNPYFFLCIQKFALYFCGMRKALFCFLFFLPLSSCWEASRDCQSVHEGKFRFEMEIDGVKKTTIFERTDSIEIEHFEGRSDTASIRWVSDCEYVLSKLHPKNRAESKAISFKILTTTDDSYTFEFAEVGNPNKIKGTAYKIN